MVERRMVEDGAMLADGLSANGTPPPVYSTDRVCVEPGCAAKLSRYNSTEWCALHESPLSTDRPFDTSVRQRGRRRNSSGRRRSRSRREAA
jgi:predicted nucleic acid binding AN1-type Zn finger protein